MKRQVGGARRPQAERRGEDARVVGHGLRPAGVLGEGRRPESPGAPPASHEGVDRLLHVRQPHAGMAQQGELHGEAQPVGVAAALGHEIPVGSGEGVVSRQGVRDHRGRRTAAGALRRSAVSARHRLSSVPKTSIMIVDGRLWWTYSVDGIAPRPRGGAARRPENGRLGDGMGDILGYARVSTGDQDVAGQTMRLTEAGAIKVFTDVRSGRTMDRPGLDALLDYARKGDTLAVVRLDRLGRSLAELLATVAMLRSAASRCSAWRRRSTPPRPPASWCSTCSARSLISSGG